MPRFTDADSAGWEFTPAERSRTRAGIERLTQIRAARAALEAEEAAELAALTSIAADQCARMPEASAYAFPVRSMAAELALALKESPRSMQARMDQAFVLVEQFPAAHAALADGRITARHAREIADAGIEIPDETARADYEAEIVPLAATLTPGRLRSLARQVAEKHQPATLEARQKQARGARGVWLGDLPDGNARLEIVGPAVVIYGIYDRLTGCAKAVRKLRRENPGVADERHMDHLRADIAADLLLSGTGTGHPFGQIAATVEVLIPVTTLAGLDDEGALLAGYGPIDADTARRLAAGAVGWERLFLNPDTGALLTVDHRTPTAAQRRYLLARDGTCRVPGCSTTAKSCDIDHTIAWSRGGPTEVGNLAALCEPHHMMKHHSPWRVRQRRGGVMSWSSPAGYEHLESPPIQIIDAYTGGRAPFDPPQG